ncbi:conserved hypothetical protein [Ricinus communis]|uniref:Uncharacterized protein n=1 Tax=Ricinus communis TaxID=3988 RepID=B9TJR2_RICCO|nr:conserved hypothetical protein [Ricinus communis]
MRALDAHVVPLRAAQRAGQKAQARLLRAHARDRGHRPRAAAGADRRVVDEAEGREGLGMVAPLEAGLQLLHQTGPVQLQRGRDQRRGGGIGVIGLGELLYQCPRRLGNRAPRERAQQRAQFLAPDGIAFVELRIQRGLSARHRGTQRHLVGQLQRARLLQPLVLMPSQLGHEEQVVPHRMALGQLTQAHRALDEEAGLGKSQRRGARAGVHRDLLRGHQADGAAGGHARGRSFISLCHSGWWWAAQVSVTVPRVIARNEPLTQIAA